jgi:branched-chain amino acid aminotransferase
MKIFMHRFILHNDKICESTEACLSPGQVGSMAGWGVFSTMRVFDGVLFAYERHFARMQRDAKLMRVPFPEDSAYITNRLEKLLDANGVRDASLRVIVVRNKGGMWEGAGISRDFDLIAFTSNVNNWGKGVRLGVIPQARHAACPFAGVKVLSWAQNLAWYEEAHERGLDEVVLLNERGEVSECTSANIFVAMGNQVWTPPVDAGCLPGITRELLLEAIHIPGIEVIEKTIMPADLEAADEVFITSTTRNLLPVVSIEGLTLRHGADARLRLDAAFTSYVDSYVAAHRPSRMSPAVS